MITYNETPPRVDMLDSESRTRCEMLSSLLSDTGTIQQCSNGFDLLSLPAGSVVLIRKGMFKYFYTAKLIRLYHDRDMLLLPTISGTECRCISEFGAEIVLYTQEQLQTADIAQEAMKLLIEFSAIQSEIMHILSTIGRPDDVTPDLKFNEYAAGSTILEEGEPAREIYMLVSGKASVTVKGVVVGTVHPGEVFGEISFFTTGTRSATVSAEDDCMVQIMTREDFVSLVKVKPSMNIAISKTLSERLIDTNRRIAGSS